MALGPGRRISLFTAMRVRRTLRSPSPLTPANRVLVRLKVAAEYSIQNFESGDPFHRADPVPAGDNEPDRRAMAASQGFSVHAKGEQRVRMQGLRQREPAGETHDLRMIGFCSRVRAFTYDLQRVAQGLGTLQHQR